MHLKYFPLYFWKSLIVIAGILYLSFAPPSTFQGIPSFEYEDKLVHMSMFTCLTCVLIFDYLRSGKQNKPNTLAFILVCLAFPVFLGGAIEILQPLYFAPRTAEWTDWFSDITGVLLGYAGLLLIKPRLSKTK